MNSRVRRFLVAATLAAVPLACSSPTPPQASPGTSSPTSASPRTTASEMCSSDSSTVLAEQMSRFLAAYNRGDVDVADGFFAPEPQFQWYSEPGLRTGDAAYDRSTLKTYFVGRHAAGDHLELEDVDINGTRRNVLNLGFVVARSDRRLQSKGAVDCATGAFIAWSLGPDPGPR